MIFNDELEFEAAVVHELKNHGWKQDVLKRPTEEDLIENWKNILYHNNRQIDKLGDYPLTDGEMGQILDQIAQLKTPLKINGFINGKSVSIIRDNPDDTLHLGKEVSLHIYDRSEIAGGKSYYQIAEQPILKTNSPTRGERRGDIMLLINGMPVIHIELKKSGVPVQNAIQQLKRYAYSGVYTGIFSLVQIFVAMNPDETIYFANPGPVDRWDSNYFFHWGDFNNEPINDWKMIVSGLLSIPMAHQMIGFYTVQDDGDGALKVMRSYQYYASMQIAKRTAEKDWETNSQRGGYVWHTTGSGKTLTSFKSAQIIANSGDADKVIFLVDRIDLGTQSFQAYSNFADDDLDVQETKNTRALIQKMLSTNPSDTLIVTSIQKMSNVQRENGVNEAELDKINAKRIVFIVDECHRSVFGDQMATIKATFPRALFFGFTGTPIQEENQKKNSMTSTIFGDELHRYSIADGIRDKNVLGFDVYQVLTFKDNDLREVVARNKAKLNDDDDVYAPENKKKRAVYERYRNLTMSDKVFANDETGIEHYLSSSQYDGNPVHHKKVIEDIKDNWNRLSQNGKFHAMLATSSIPEATAYYEQIKEEIPDLKITALFETTFDEEPKSPNSLPGYLKEDALVRIVDDYNGQYDQSFTLASFPQMKKDIAMRLAHKGPYIGIENDKEKCLDLLIVVNQMLTGYDSKWINTLYVDKRIENEMIIQAFSRTNRLFGPEKPFGTIRYYRYPHTMKRRIEAAVKLYAGEKAFDLFADRLPYNLESINDLFRDIKQLFESEGIVNFSQNPTSEASKKKFAKLFTQLAKGLEAAKIQGFTWKRKVYDNEEGAEEEYHIIVELDEHTYRVLLQRYKELGSSGRERGEPELPYAIDGTLIELQDHKIDSDYLDSKFSKYIKELLESGPDSEYAQKLEKDLHYTFAELSEKEQRNASIILGDIKSGDLLIDESKSFRDYLNAYAEKQENDDINQIANAFGLDQNSLRKILNSHVTKANINEYGRFDQLMNDLDSQKAKVYLERINNTEIKKKDIMRLSRKKIREFILGFSNDKKM